MPVLARIIEAIAELAPWDLAEPWDQVGLQVGNRAKNIRKVLINLDFNHRVLDEGLKQGVDGFIVHHPLIFKPLAQITDDTFIGNSLKTLLKHDLFLVSVHTNIDKAKHGLNQYLAELFNLNETRPISSVESYCYKVVVFIPETHTEVVRHAMTEAGAGIIGNYVECSFELAGTGTFKPGTNAQPYLGKPGVLERAPEIRLEMLVEKDRLSQVLQAINQTHPYEEPAIDIFPLDNPPAHGLGRIGNLPQPVTLEEFCRMVKEKLSAKDLRVCGDYGRSIRRVALCSGSGRDLLSEVIHLGADLYLTGELGYHDYITARDNGLSVITAGHFSTEICFIQLMTAYLNSYFKSETEFEMIVSKIQEEPYLTL